MSYGITLPSITSSSYKLDEKKLSLYFNGNKYFLSFKSKSVYYKKKYLKVLSTKAIALDCA